VSFCIEQGILPSLSVPEGAVWENFLKYNQDGRCSRHCKCTEIVDFEMAKMWKMASVNNEVSVGKLFYDFCCEFSTFSGTIDPIVGSV